MIFATTAKLSTSSTSAGPVTRQKRVLGVFFVIPESLRLRAWSAWTPERRPSAMKDTSVAENMVSGRDEEREDAGEGKILRLTSDWLSRLLSGSPVIGI